TYVYQSANTATGYAGDGLDTLLDSGGQNTLAVDGTILAGGDQYGDARVHKDANGHLYVQAGANLIIDGNLAIQNYGAGGTFGLNLSATPVANPVSTNTITGDLAPIDQDTVVPGVQPGYDSLGNVLSNPNVPDTGRADALYGDTGNDVIVGKGGGDILDGSSGDDRLYADAQIDAAQAIALGNTQQGTGITGDWLNGGTGNDILVGSNGNDLLAGGAGDDLLIGGAGNDAILGDNDTLPGNFPGQTWHYDALTKQMWLDNVITNEPSQPAASGNDVIYAGEGNDRAFGGYGNDVIFGEAGGDVLQGNSGNDVLLGGAGQDYLYGDLSENNTIPSIPGDDYLDGGEGTDLIYGNEGNDILIGGAGTDALFGGAGADTYIYNVGDGIDHIYDNNFDHNVLRIAGA
ncbi:MAG: calcium-binding protein, partial [Planctomycetota bacterium]